MSKDKKRTWSPQDIERLTKAWENDQSPTEIGKLLGRSPAIIRAKVSHLRATRPDLKKSLEYRVDWRGSKLKAKDIPKIRKDNRTLRLIGDQYGVSAVTIYKIKAGETWRDA